MIENIELLAFVRENLALARTIVIKNEDLAILDNANMLKYSNIDSGTDKSKWRYYLNLNGEYHFTDEIMIVKSLDDNELIDFTKKNIEDHPATKKAYRLGGYYFSRLVAQYPHQMELIQGIINPIPPEESIPAKNYQILRYTKEYVEWNEFQLIPKLQDFINQTVYQSFNTEYKDTDDLLLPVLIGHLSEGMYKFLLECRFEHRFSRNAHSFFIWSFLQSKGISPIYKTLLNNKQTMWLFRNIDYVLRNLGKSGTFKELIEILLSERNIPLAKYDLIQSTETMSKDLHSEPLFFSERLNLIETRGLGQQTNKIARTMLKEVPESLDNEIYYDKFLPTTTAESTYGDQTTYPTKILDSELVDTTNRKPETIYNLLNNELIYLAGKELYNINLDIEDPLSGIHQRVSVKDAIVLWHHLLNKFNGADCNQIPSFYYQDVLKVVPPTIETIQSVGAKPFLNENWCRDLLNTYIPQIRMVSPSVFYENAMAIFNLKWDHVKMYSRWLSIGYYSRRKNAISTMYETGFMKLTDKKTYSEFLEQYDFDFSSYRKEDYFSLMWEIWRKMTGWDQFSHITIGQIQDGMIGLMKFLSSYSVQYIHQTTMEEGWYEGGLDLMTENPGLLHPGGDGQLELESNVESNRIPVHHRVVMTAEEEETLYLDNRLDTGTIAAEMEMVAEVFETPNLYYVELDDTDKDDGFHSSQVMDFDNKLRLFTGKLPYDLEDLIPEGGAKADSYTLKEMIVDTFIGKQQVGPWKAKEIWIVKNKGLDNKAVAEEVDGFEYAKIMKVEEVEKDGETYNQYYIGFVPGLIGDSLIKLDVIAEQVETGESVHVRFDYNIETKQNSWAISYEIPESVSLEKSFPITPTITGLNLNGAEIVKEVYTVYPDIEEYLTVDNGSGQVSGKFLKPGWPEKLPLLYTLVTSDPTRQLDPAEHHYFMRGYVPSDRYYDPLLDPGFEPKGTYFEADTNAVTLERFSVTASNKGWEAVDLYMKTNADGTYLAGKVKTDYEGIAGYLSPKLTDRKYVDKTVDGKVIRTFEWLYAIAAETGVTLDLVLKLQNIEGEVVLRDFQYKPTVIDHGTNAVYDILPETGYKFGIHHTTETSLTVNGLGDGITLTGGVEPKLIPGQSADVSITYSSVGTVTGNKVGGYAVRPLKLITKNISWVVQVEGSTKAKNGTTLVIRPYGKITINSSDVVDYNVIDVQSMRIFSWGANIIYTHAIAPSRYRVKDSTNGWVVEDVQIKKTNDNYPEFVATKLPGNISSNDIAGYEPTVTLGIGDDGADKIPSGWTRWFTIHMLGNRNYVGDKVMDLAVPLEFSIKNKYTGDTTKTVVELSNQFYGLMFNGARDPEELWAGTENLVKPSYKNMPLAAYGEADLISSEGIFLGADKYIGGTGYKDPTVCTWNDDETATIAMPAPPMFDGLGIRIYNKRVYRSKDPRYIGDSVRNIIYFPYVDYNKNEILRMKPLDPTDIDFINLDNVDFFQGVRSSYVISFDLIKLYYAGWNVSKTKLDVVGRDDESSYIQTSLNGKNLRSDMYATGVWNNRVHDAPNKRQGYVYFSFVPVKLGKQTFTATVEFSHTSGLITNRPYKCEFTIDVKPKEGNIIFDSSYPDPWWLTDKETFVLTKLTNVNDGVNDKGLLSANVNDNDAEYISIRGGINPALSSSKALGVTVLKRYTGISPKAIVTHKAQVSGYPEHDERENRRYYDILPVNADRLYDASEIDLDAIEFTPDVVWNPMRVNESVTERYEYNANTKGWYINAIRTQDESDWMNHYFEYKGQLVKDDLLFNATKQNVTKDGIVDAPAGKMFYLPLYGGRKVGKYPVKLNIMLSNKHQSTSASINLTYVTEREIVASDVGFKLGYEEIYIGKSNVFTGGFEKVPTGDVHEGMIVSADNLSAIGKKKDAFTPTVNPYGITVAPDYKEGSGNGLKLAAAKVYGDVAPGKVLETATWIRAYRGEQIINEEEITTKIEYPEVSDFDITLLPSELFQGVAGTFAYMFNPKSASDKGWTCTVKGLSAFGTNEQSEVMTTSIKGRELDDKYIYDYGTASLVPSDAPESTKGYSYGYVTYMPAKAGKQVVKVSILIEHKSSKVQPETLVFDIELDIKENEGSIGFSSTNPDPWYLIDQEIKLFTSLSDYSGTVTADSQVIALNTPASEEFITVKAVQANTGLNGWQMLITARKDFAGKDRDVIVGHTVIIAGGDDSDKRKVRTYYDVIQINNAHVYSLDNLKPSLVDLQADIIFEEMEQNTSYTERYSYLKKSTSGWVVEKTRIVEDKEWMNHIFEYDGDTGTSAQLFSAEVSKQSTDRTISAPDGRWFSLPTYGGRKAGEFEVTFEITITTSQFGSLMTGVIAVKQKRKIVDAGIGFKVGYDKLVLGKKNSVSFNSLNIPRPDLKEGVITSNVYYNKVGSNTKYFTINKSPESIDIDSGYQGGNPTGVMITLVQPYTARRAGSNANSTTDNRAYRGEWIIKDKDITLSPEMFGIVPANNQPMTKAVCTERFYVKQASELAASGWTIDRIGIKGINDGTVDPSLLVTEAPGFAMVDLYSEAKSAKSPWVIDGVNKDAFLINFTLQDFTGPTNGGKEDRTRTIPLVIEATFGDKKYEIDYDYVTPEVLAGRSPEFALSYAAYNYWPVNFKDEKKTTMQVSNVLGNYAKRRIGFVRPYGDNSSKTSVSTINQGSLTGSANTVFGFSEVSEEDFRYAVMTNHTVTSGDEELTSRRFFGTYVIDSYRVQDYDSWDLKEFAYNVGQFKPMYINEYGVLELKALGFKNGLGINTAEIMQFSADIIQDSVTVDGVVTNLPVQHKYQLNVNKTGSNRLSTAPESYCFLGFMPKTAGNFTVRLKVTYIVQYSSYSRTEEVVVPFRVMEARSHMGLIGKMYWDTDADRNYLIATHRVPEEGVDNVTFIGDTVQTLGNSNLKLEIRGGIILNAKPDINELDKPAEFFIYKEFTDNSMDNQPARASGVLLRHKFINSGYEWLLDKTTEGKTGTRNYVTSAFVLRYKGEKSTDRQTVNGAGRHVINGVTHAVGYGGGTVVNGETTRSYLTSYFPECLSDIQAFGETNVANTPVHIQSSTQLTSYAQRTSLRSRAMYVNGVGNLVMKFAYHDGNKFAALPTNCKFTSEKWQVNGSATVDSNMADMTMVDFKRENVYGVGIITLEFEKPAGISRFIYNSRLTIDSVMSAIQDDGTEITLPIRVEKGYLNW